MNEFLIDLCFLMKEQKGIWLIPITVTLILLSYIFLFSSDYAAEPFFFTEF
jgi:Family of unknown function (DUF5989)